MKPMKLKNGKKIKNLQELSHALKSMPEGTFKYHVSDSKNDFYTWIKKEHKDINLAKDILECTTKEAVMFCLQTKLPNKENNTKFNKLKIKQIKPWSARSIIKRLKEVYQID